MAQFSVKVQNVEAQVSEIENLRRELSQIQTSVESIKNGLSFKISAQVNIRGKLKNASTAVGEEKNVMAAMGRGLQEVSSQYYSTEKRINGNGDVALFSVGTAVTAASTVSSNEQKNNDYSPDWMDLLWKSVGEFGVAGKTVSSIVKFATGDKSKFKTWGELIKNGEKIWEKVGDAVKTSKDGINVEWVKGLFGLNTKEIIPDALKNTGKLKQTANGFWSGIKTGASKINKFNVGATFIADAFGNVDEYRRGEISKTRAAWETIVETGVDIGKGVVANGIATGALALLGIANTPAVVVGVASVAVVWGADVIFEKITGKKMTELISDKLVDFGEKAVEKAGKMKDYLCDKVGNAVNNAKNNVKAMWKGLFPAFA